MYSPRTLSCIVLGLFSRQSQALYAMSRGKGVDKQCATCNKARTSVLKTTSAMSKQRSWSRRISAVTSITRYAYKQLRDYIFLFSLPTKRNANDLDQPNLYENIFPIINLANFFRSICLQLLISMINSTVLSTKICFQRMLRYFNYSSKIIIDPSAARTLLA